MRRRSWVVRRVGTSLRVKYTDIGQPNQRRRPGSGGGADSCVSIEADVRGRGNVRFGRRILGLRDQCLPPACQWRLERDMAISPDRFPGPRVPGMGRGRRCADINRDIERRSIGNGARNGPSRVSGAIPPGRRARAHFEGCERTLRRSHP